MNELLKKSIEKSNKVQTYVNGILTPEFNCVVVKTIPIGDDNYKVYAIRRCVFGKHSITCTTHGGGYETRRLTTFYNSEDAFNKAILRISKMNLI
jgi:hypothetical protein